MAWSTITPAIVSDVGRRSRATRADAGPRHTVSFVAIVLLLRHGHSTANADGVLAGWTEGVGLTDTGREQAARVARRLAPLPVARAVSSPLQRCLETAAVALAGHDRLAATTGWGSATTAAWTGRSLAGGRHGGPLARRPGRPGAATFPAHDHYAAESLAEMAERVVGAVRALDAEVEAEHGADAVWVAVSHGDPIKAVVAEAVGAGPRRACSACGWTPARSPRCSITATRMVLLASNTVEGDLAPLVARPEARPGG